MHPRAQGLSKGDEHPTIMGYGTLYIFTLSGEGEKSKPHHIRHDHVRTVCAFLEHFRIRSTVSLLDDETPKIYV